MGMETITIFKAENDLLKSAQTRVAALQQENNWPMRRYACRASSALVLPARKARLRMALCS